jgi:hypothetical protein
VGAGGGCCAVFWDAECWVGAAGGVRVREGGEWRGDGGGLGGGQVAMAAAARPATEAAEIDESVGRRRLAATAAGLGGGASLRGAAAV